MKDGNQPCRNARPVTRSMNTHADVLSAFVLELSLSLKRWADALGRGRDDTGCDRATPDQVRSCAKSITEASGTDGPAARASVHSVSRSRAELREPAPGQR